MQTADAWCLVLQFYYEIMSFAGGHDDEEETNVLVHGLVSNNAINTK